MSGNIMDLISKLRIAIQFIGLKAVLRTVFYAIYRDIQDFQYKNRSRHARNPAKSPGNLISYKENEHGIEVNFENGFTLEIRVLSNRGVCFTWQPGKLPYSDFLGKYVKRSGITHHYSMATRINSSSSDPDALFGLRTNTMRVVFRKTNEVITQTPSGEVLSVMRPPTLSNGTWQIENTLQDGEAVHGLGERAAGLNLVGSSFSLWNSSPGGSYGHGQDPLYMTIPLLMATNKRGSYLIFFENTHKGKIDLSQAQLVRSEFEGGALRYYVFTGDPSSLLQQYSALTGRPNLPPIWSLGFHQSRWGYESEDDLRTVLDGFKENNLPLQALHQDIDYMDGFRVFTINRSKYPDIKKLAVEMATRNIRLVTIIDPGVKIDLKYPVYAQGLKNNSFVKTRNGKIARALVWPDWCAFPDFTSSKVRDWWGKQYAELLNMGVAGFWHDMNEPETFSAWGDPTLPYSSVHDFDGSPADHVEAHNIYGHLMNQAGFEALRRLQPKNRPWLLSRSGWAGSQKHAWHWTADIESTWEALELCVPMLLNLGLSGFSYSGTDIGGFTGNPDAELYTRWFQMAAFQPLFRNHAAKGTRKREPWVYGEPYTSIIRTFIELRIKMLPYWYTLAEEANRTGAPLMRPLFWYHPANRDLHNVNDAFLLGEDVLIAPVTQPAQKEKTVSFPPGSWYDFWSGRLVDSSASDPATVSIEKIPIYIRAGAVIPLEENGRLDLRIYLDEKGKAEGRIYYDAYDGYDVGGELKVFAERSGTEVQIKIKKTGVYPSPWKIISPTIVGHSDRIRITRDD